MQSNTMRQRKTVQFFTIIYIWYLNSRQQAHSLESRTVALDPNSLLMPTCKWRQGNRVFVGIRHSSSPPPFKLTFFKVWLTLSKTEVHKLVNRLIVFLIAHMWCQLLQQWGNLKDNVTKCGIHLYRSVSCNTFNCKQF